MNHQIFKQSYTVRSIDINANKKLGLYSLLGLLQDITSEHASLLNFGYEAMKEQGFFWVLVRQKLKIDVWPKWGDTITIKTWTLPIKEFYAIREYELFLNNHKIGACSTTWMILDSKTRKPKDVNKEQHSFSPRTDYHLQFTANKITVPNILNPQKKVEVQLSDLDMNHHVNNIKYSQWMLNTLPFQYHKKQTISEFEINFLSETFLGDTITCFNNIDKVIHHEVYFSGINEKTSKKAFVAKLKTTPNQS